MCVCPRGERQGGGNGEEYPDAQMRVCICACLSMRQCAHESVCLCVRARA